MAARPKAFWPLVIDGVNGAIPGHSAIAAGTYYSASDFAAAVGAALSRTVTVGPTGRLTITGGATTLDFSGAPPVAALLGFAAANYSGTTLVGGRQHANGWYSDRGIGADLGNVPDSPGAAATVALNGVVKSLIWPERTMRTLTFALQPSHKVKMEFEVPSKSLDGGDHAGEAIERLWQAARSDRFRYWPDATVDGDYIDLCFFDADSIKTFDPQRPERKALYTWTWKLRKYVEG